ncbi:MAG: hypothetical protein EXS67_04065 [Candidatus Margulisbacteria bacterium]|nr:hypothetical protein [Candidatus Margulisiibacteriota bacterium]
MIYQAVSYKYIAINSRDLVPLSSNKIQELQVKIKQTFESMTAVNQQSFVEKLIEESLNENKPILILDERFTRVLLSFIFLRQTELAFPKSGELNDIKSFMAHHCSGVDLIMLFKVSLSQPMSLTMVEQLRVRLELPPELDDYVNISIKAGKVVWQFFDHQAQKFYAPLKGQNKQQILQEVSIKDRLKPEESMRLTIEQFVRFKEAGKRHGSTKETLLKTRVLMTRIRRDRNERSANGNYVHKVGAGDPNKTKAWDVDSYYSLNIHKKDTKSFWLEHCVQHDYLVTKYFGRLEKILEVLNTLNDTENFTDIEKAKEIFIGFKAELKWLGKEYQNQDATFATPFQNLNTLLNKPTILGVIKALAERQHITQKAVEELMGTFQAAALFQTLQDDLASTREEIEEAKQNIADHDKGQAFTIALPFQADVSVTAGASTIHKDHSLSKALYTEINGFFTALTETTNTLSMKTESVQDSIQKDIAAIGAFRYLYRQTVKRYGLETGEAIQQLDASFLGYLKSWAQGV